jgi:hypothetical protein
MTIKVSKIHKVLIAICKLDPIPRDEELIFERDVRALLGNGSS